MAEDDILDEEVADGQFQPTASSGLSKVVKILIYVALGSVGLVLMSVISYFVAYNAAATQFKEVASVAVVKPPPPTEAFRFQDDFRVNTADQGEPHFIKMKLSFGFEQGNAALSAELAQRSSQLRDLINLILGAKRKEDLSSMQSRLELREEIKASVNHVLSNGKIVDVYFEEFIIN